MKTTPDHDHFSPPPAVTLPGAPVPPTWTSAAFSLVTILSILTVSSAWPPGDLQVQVQSGCPFIDSPTVVSFADTGSCDSPPLPTPPGAPQPPTLFDSNIPGPLLPMGLSAASSARSSLTFLPYVFDVLPQFLKSLLTCHLLDEVHLDCPLSFDDLTSAHWPCSPS